ncbi:MAG: hypothetical protein QOK43_1159 [Acidimicrobiaceae bacterium]|nr:hypothetical protein [Acidimicrobiaceae bacterium]
MPQKRSLIAVLLAVVLLPLSAVLGVQAIAAGPSGPKLHLQIGSFDPAASTPLLPGLTEVAVDSPGQATPGKPAAWIVQATDAAAQPAVVAAVQASGATVLGYLSDQAYAVYATPEQRVVFVNQAGPLVHFSGPFQPSWRVRPAVGANKAVSELTGTQTLVVNFFHALTEAQKAAAFGAVTALSGVQVKQGSAGQDAVRITVDGARVPAIAARPEVEWVDTPAHFKLLNATARWVTDTGSRETLRLTNPVGGLTGAGQTAAVADTGWNYLPDVKGDAQAYFSDCPTPTTCKEADYTLTSSGADPNAVVANHTGHRKLAAYFDLGGSGTRPSDPDSHGTHTAGSVTGNIAPTDQLNAADGMAWASRLVHQNIADPAGGLGGIPSPIAQLFLEAYRPSAPPSVAGHDPAKYALYNPSEDARTHNNSWGGDPNLAVANATGLDQFVWDHEDMNIIVSAGNDATGSSPGVVGTVGAPATAKNDLTSGASANGDQPQASPETLAAFSSHGPTADGRYGPDLVTPGQIVVSAKGSTASDTHYLQGTSMSAPLLTGISTLVRQYFWDGFGPTLPTDKSAEGIAVGAPSVDRRFNPSSALVKAVLVNGAQRMRGFYTGDDGTSRAQDGKYPSAGQGFGLVNLDNSLFLPNDPTTLWVKDVWRDTYNGKLVNPADATVGNPEAFTGPSASPQVKSYDIAVEAGQPLTVSLAWIDAPSLASGTPQAAPALINNLDLTVTDPGGNVYRGNNFNTVATPKAPDYETPAGGSADTKNNVEKVRLAAPVSGTYTVKVTAPSLNFVGAQGFALAASGKITGPGAAPATGAGWKADPTPNAPATVTSSTVQTTSSDTAVVYVNTNEPTKAVLRTSNGGVYPSVDTVDASGFPGLPSGFTAEIPDNTGFPPAAGAHDMISSRHRILITGPRTRDVNMTVDLTDMEGRTSTVFLGLLSEGAGLYQAPLDDIAQFASDDATYGGFNSKTTQMYVGNLSGGLGNLLGTYKFTVPDSVDPTTVGAAVVEATSGHDLTSHDSQEWIERSQVLPDSLEANWRSNTYGTIHGAAPVATLNPVTGVRHGNQAVYDQAVTCDSLSAFRSNLADKQVAVRMEADTGPLDAAVSFEPGANRRSRGPQFRPNLMLYTQQPDGSLLDPRPCDSNAPAPAISDVRVEHNANSNGLTYSGVVSWTTDVPSDSTVLIRPRGSNSFSWVEVSVPGRTTNHIVEVRNLGQNVDYEFVVNSASCNGKNSTDSNGGAGYAFVPPAAAPYSLINSSDFEPSGDAWVPSQGTRSDSSPTNPADNWTLATDAANSPTHSFKVAPYGDNDEAILTSPTFNTAAGKLHIAWFQRIDTEEGFDILHVEYNVGAGWVEAGSFSGKSTHFDNGGWDREDLAVDVPVAPEVQVRYRFESDGGTSSADAGYSGVWIDDVTIGLNGPGAQVAKFPVKALSAASAITAPVVPLRREPSAVDQAAGTARCGAVTSKVFIPPAAVPVHGYWLTAADAGLFAYGDAKFVGSRGGQPLNSPIVGMASKADHLGYWQVASDGGIFTYGNATFHGSMGGKPLNSPVVGMAALPDGSGYWLVASDGGIFAFGAAQSRFYGSMGGQHLNKPIVGMAVTPDGSGYWLVASDGGIFAFGSAVGRFYGSAGGLPLASPITGMEPTPAGDGYWLVAKDGGVFAYGEASRRFFGSMAGRGVNDVVGLAATSGGDGYWLVGGNGGVYAFGQAPQLGAPTNVKLLRPLVGLEGY